ncbi:unnamed protein product [Enterobius vermicularis]|uniref:Galectin n=1 Tax=Enterobius vermicularis TaxID=51028 RepID=A0A0N4V4X1_ENTVE|nr:unnamed protein product [Enterobius vermicularis]
MVFNNRKNGEWGQEEQRLKNPFSAGGEFDLRIRVNNENFQVFGNRGYLGSITQKAPLDQIRYIRIDGDLSGLRLVHYGGVVFKLPYYGAAALTPGKRLDISAWPAGNKINIELHNSQRQHAFHMSIRFNEGAIVRNAMVENSWGPEERGGGFPLSKNKVFDLTLVNENYGYQIYFNGRHFASFAHRVSPTDITVLKIAGDLELYSVMLNDA